MKISRTAGISTFLSSLSYAPIPILVPTYSLAFTWYDCNGNAPSAITMDVLITVAAMTGHRETRRRPSRRLCLPMVGGSAIRGMGLRAGNAIRGA